MSTQVDIANIAALIENQGGKIRDMKVRYFVKFVVDRIQFTPQFCYFVDILGCEGIS